MIPEIGREKIRNEHKFLNRGNYHVICNKENIETETIFNLPNVPDM